MSPGQLDQMSLKITGTFIDEQDDEGLQHIKKVYSA